MNGADMSKQALSSLTMSTSVGTDAEEGRDMIAIRTGQRYRPAMAMGDAWTTGSYLVRHPHLSGEKFSW